MPTDVPRRRMLAAVGSSLFFTLAPGMVAGVVPWMLTGWEVRDPPYWLPLRIVGAVVLAFGVAVMIHAFVRFVVEGLGTPAPTAPTERLVVGGLYRHVRNPMYLAVAAATVGQAVLLGQPGLILYGAAVTLANAGFLHWYEEPTLLRQFGPQYATYRQAVPAWFPRWRPWHGGHGD